MQKDAPGCRKMRPDAERCTRMQKDAPGCRKMHPDAERCTRMQKDAPGCRKMHPDAERCARMQKDAPGCRKMHQDAERFTCNQQREDTLSSSLLQHHPWVSSRLTSLSSSLPRPPLPPSRILDARDRRMYAEKCKRIKNNRPREEETKTRNTRNGEMDGGEERRDGKSFTSSSLLFFLLDLQPLRTLRNIRAVDLFVVVFWEQDAGMRLWSNTRGGRERERERGGTQIKRGRGLPSWSLSPSLRAKQR